MQKNGRRKNKKYWLRSQTQPPSAQTMRKINSTHYMLKKNNNSNTRGRRQQQHRRRGKAEGGSGRRRLCFRSRSGGRMASGTLPEARAAEEREGPQVGAGARPNPRPGKALFTTLCSCFALVGPQNGSSGAGSHGCTVLPLC